MTTAGSASEESKQTKSLRTAGMIALCVMLLLTLLYQIKQIKRELVVEGPKKEINPATLLSPTYGSRWVTRKPNHPIRFKWEDLSPSPGRSGAFRLQVAKDAQFAALLVDAKVAAGESTIVRSLAAGDYYWRIVSPDGRSDPGRFQVIQHHPPRLESPKSLTTDAGTASLQFSWSRAGTVESFERFEFSRDPGFRAPLTLDTAPEPSSPGLGTTQPRSYFHAFMDGDMFEGTCYWRVVSRYEKIGNSGDQVVEFRTAPRRFEIGQRRLASTSLTDMQESIQEEDGGWGVDVKSVFSFGLRSSFSRLNGLALNNNTGAVLVSDLNLGLDLKWAQDWSEDFSTFERFGISRVTIRSSSSGTSVSNGAGYYSELAVGMEYRLLPSLSVAGAIGASQEVFYRGNDSGPGITIDSILMPKAQLLSKYRFLEINSLSLALSVEGGATWLIPRSTDVYSISGGLGAQAAFTVERQFEPTTLGASLYYEYQTQNTSILSVSRTNLGLALAISF